MKIYSQDFYQLYMAYGVQLQLLGGTEAQNERPIFQVTFKNLKSNLIHLILLYLMIHTIPRKLFSVKNIL